MKQNYTFKKTVFKPHSSTKALFCYGTDPIIYQELEKWLEEDCFLIFLEDEASRLDKFSDHTIGKQALAHPNVRICFIETPYQIRGILKKMLWEMVFKPAEIFSCKDESYFKEIEKLFLELKEGIHFTASEYSDFGYGVIKNIYENITSLQRFKKFEDLKSQFSKIPAIIIGAGPSLGKNQEILKNLRSKALFLAGGTALNGLKQRPHFAASIDKEAPYRRFKHAGIENVPFIFQPRILSDNLKTVHSDLILAPDSSSFPLEDWMAKELKLYQKSMDAGWNVGTFLIKTAHHLGCDPIILVGMDLAKSKDQLYVEGTGISQDKDISFVKTSDLYGKEVYTQRDWLIARSWIEDFAKNSDRSFYNASEGLDFGKKVRNIRLQEIPFKDEYDLDALVHHTLQILPCYQLSEAKKKRTLQTIEKSIRLCSFFIGEKWEELKDAYEEELQIDLLFHECEGELFYDEHLFPLWEIFRPVFIKGEKGLGALIHQLLFFQNVAQTHLDLLKEQYERNV